ncbi:hypothetical protein GCM10023185_43480 [Hymenobacter saemangeumensis]|uniref:DUF4350 domain-containing protein n=1 Tax=Hymenobacter saemangeumensis TaxID=1084522 RepID=A0ABP8IRZ6_9BACT
MPQLTTFRLYLLGMGLLFAAYVALEYNRPKPLDWTPTLANKDKIPYGTFALYDQLPRLLGTDSVEVVRLPVYSQLTGLSQVDTGASSEAEEDAESSIVEASDSSALVLPDSIPDAEARRREQLLHASEQESTEIPLRDVAANYVFVGPDFDLSKLDARALLQHVHRGNDVFIATSRLRSYRSWLSDTLGFSITQVELPTQRNAKKQFVADSVTLQFTNPALARSRYRLAGTDNNSRIEVKAGRAGRTLATDAQGRPVYVRLDSGQGHFYICSVPLAFSNYYLLRPRTTGFAAGALAYLPARRSWWDEYQKQGPIGEQSLLRVLIAHDALRAAYYLTLLGTLLFVAVYARRRQRIIPTIRPLPNTTLLFTRTVAGLYRQGSNHALIAEKKVGLFLDYLRTRFQEPSPDLNDEAFRERLSQKAGLPRPRLDELLRQVNFARSAPTINDQQLLKLSKALSEFRREANRR